MVIFFIIIIINVGISSPLSVVPTLGSSPELYKKVEEALRSKPGSNAPLWSLHQFLPPGSTLGSCPDFP